MQVWTHIIVDEPLEKEKIQIPPKKSHKFLRTHYLKICSRGRQSQTLCIDSFLISLNCFLG